jgi:hypothetical protein
LGFLAPRTRWLISFCWIAVAIITFVAVDAPSFRSWLYLMTVALVPPVVMYGLLHENQTQTIADVMHGGRS